MRILITKAEGKMVNNSINIFIAGRRDDDEEGDEEDFPHGQQTRCSNQ